MKLGGNLKIRDVGAILCALALPSVGFAGPNFLQSQLQLQQRQCAQQNPPPESISRAWQNVQEATAQIHTEENFHQRIHSEHQVQIIDENHAALEKRIQMIRSAKQSIDLESYIFGSDLSARIILNELAEAARRGVKVRILVDRQGAGPRLLGRKGIAAQLSALEIEFKFFNDTPLINFGKANFRTHRKMLIVDGQSSNGQLLTGGRNIADDYFGLATDHNYTDRDVYLRGKVAKVARGSFDAFWNSDYATYPKKSLTDGRQYINHGDIALSEAEKEKRDQIRKIGRKQLAKSPTQEANDVSFISDKPGRAKSDRIVAPVIWEELLSAKKSITMENYTYIKTRESEAVFQQVAKNGTQTTISTNARYFGGPRMLNGIANADQRQLVRQGITVYGRDSKAPQGEALVDPTAQQTKWTAHTKTFTADSDTYIGSSNLDPRSQNINAEVAIVIHNNSAVAKTSRDRILQRAQAQSVPMNSKGNFVDPQKKEVKLGWGRRLLDRILHVGVFPARSQL